MNLKALEMFKLGRNLKRYTVKDLIEFDENLRNGKIKKLTYENDDFKIDLFYYNYLDDIHLIFENMLADDLLPRKILIEEKEIINDKENFLYIGLGVGLKLNELRLREI